MPRKTSKPSAEKTVRDIRRATRRHYSAGVKIRIVLEGLRVAWTVLLSCAAVRDSIAMSNTAGPRSFWRLASDNNLDYLTDCLLIH
jgi:hypothetical protein